MQATFNSYAKHPLCGYTASAVVVSQCMCAASYRRCIASEFHLLYSSAQCWGPRYARLSRIVARQTEQVEIVEVFSTDLAPFVDLQLLS
jgi:hypothetical protein